MDFLYKNKRFSSFLLVFIFIFQFIFITPSYALFPNIPNPSEDTIKLITLSAVSLGLLPSSINNNTDWDSLYTYLCNSWFNTLSNEQKLEVLFAGESNEDYFVLSSNTFNSLKVAILGFFGGLNQDYSFITMNTATATYSIPITALPSGSFNYSGFYENAVIDFGATIPFMSYHGSPDNNIYSENFDINCISFLMSDTFTTAIAVDSWHDYNFSKNLKPFINVYGNLSFKRYYNTEDTRYHWAIDNVPPTVSLSTRLFVIDYIARPLNRYSSKMYFVVCDNTLYGVTNFYDRNNGGRFAGQYVNLVNADMNVDYSTSSSQSKSPFGSYILQNLTTLDIPSGVTFTIDDLGPEPYSTYIDGNKDIVITIPDNFDVNNIEDYGSADTNVVFPVPNNPALSSAMDAIETIHDDIITQADFGSLTNIYEQNKSLISDLSSNDLSWLILANNALFSHFEHFLILCCFFITISRLIK